MTKRYFGQGEEIGSTDYFYTTDHLGSIREMTDGSGTIQARYDYDPYGRQTKLVGSLDADFGFTGHYVHAPSGLLLAPFRAYDAALARWISEDPLGQIDGTNPYRYSRNNSLLYTDPSGQLPLMVVTAGIGLVASVVGNVGAQLYSNGGDIGSVNWTSVGIAAATGAAAGALAPIVAVEMSGALALGAGSNVVQHLLTQLSNGASVTLEGVAISAATGAAGGAIGGAIKIPIPFNPKSPWLDPVVTKALNERAGVAANVGASSLIRNIGGGFASNVDQNVLAGAEVCKRR